MQRHRSLVRVCAAGACLATLVAVVSAQVTFTSTWKSMDAGAVTFANKKVAALVISTDESLRMSGEEALVRELKARGIQGVASYRIIPREELQSAERAKAWFEKAGVEGVVAIRPVSAEERTVYTPSVWVNTNYATFWGYYGYGWGSVYVPGSSTRQTVVVVETTIFSVPRNQLLWAAVSETRDPGNLQEYLSELVKASVKVMHEQGLARAALK